MLPPTQSVGLMVVALLLPVTVLVALAVTATIAAIAGGGAQVGHAIKDHAEDLGAGAVH